MVISKKSKLIEYIEKDKSMDYRQDRVIRINPYYKRGLEFLSKEEFREKRIEVRDFEIEEIQNKYFDLIHRNDLMDWFNNSNEINMDRYGFSNDKKLMKRIEKVIKQIIDKEVKNEE